jgi:hypothetical protein
VRAPEGWGFQNLWTIGTWKWQVCEPYTPWRLINEIFRWLHRESSPRPFDFYRSASTNCATAYPSNQSNNTKHKKVQSQIKHAVRIFILIPIYIQQDATLHGLFYLETALHVSGGTTAHHQERIQLYLQHLVFVTPLLLSAAIATDSSNGVTNTRKKFGNTMKQCISYLHFSRKLMMQLGGRSCIIFSLSLVSPWNR